MCKKNIILLTSVVGFLSVASAAPVGPFIDASIGAGAIRTPNEYAFSISPEQVLPGGAELKRDIGGFSYRLAAGYNFTKYVGLEAAYLKPAESKYSASNGRFNASLKYKDNIGELLLDAYLPVNLVDYYAKFGMAYIHQNVSYQTDGAMQIPINTDDFSDDLKSGTFSTVAPMAGVGCAFNITPHVSTNLSYSFIYTGDDFKDRNSAVANVSYVSWGWRYTF